MLDPRALPVDSFRTHKCSKNFLHKLFDSHPKVASPSDIPLTNLCGSEIVKYFGPSGRSPSTPTPATTRHPRLLGPDFPEIMVG